MDEDSSPTIERQAAGLSGRMVIEAHDAGDGILVPRVTFEPVGRINQGWFERHQVYFLRHIQHAQVEARTGRPRPLYNENGARQ